MKKKVMKKKVFISGVTGQDGSYMAEYLLNNHDVEVVGGVRRTSQLIDANLNNLQGNDNFQLAHFELRDPHSVKAAFQTQPDYFINFGAQTFVADSWDSPIAFLETNVSGVINCLESVRKYAPECRFYNAGSSEEFGDVLYSPQDENHPLRPRSPYGASKASARHYIKCYRESYDLFAVQSWVFNHESPRRQKYFLTRKITDWAAKVFWELSTASPSSSVTPLFLGNINAKRDWSDARDVVDSVWRMLNNDKPTEYVVGSGETHSVSDMLELSMDIAGIKYQKVLDEDEDFGEEGRKLAYISNTGRPLVFIDKKFYRPAEVDLLLADPTKIKEELLWKPNYSFVDMVSEMVESDIEYGRVGKV